MARTNQDAKPTTSQAFHEQLGDRDIEPGDYKVDELRKLASSYHIAGNHDMKKTELVAALNKARHQTTHT